MNTWYRFGWSQFHPKLYSKMWTETNTVLPWQYSRLQLTKQTSHIEGFTFSRVETLVYLRIDTGLKQLYCRRILPQELSHRHYSEVVGKLIWRKRMNEAHCCHLNLVGVFYLYCWHPQQLVTDHQTCWCWKSNFEWDFLEKRVENMRGRIFHLNN